MKTPRSRKCFWCGFKETSRIVTLANVNQVTFFCPKCGGLMHFAINPEKRINSFDIHYFYEKREAR